MSFIGSLRKIGGAVVPKSIKPLIRSTAIYRYMALERFGLVRLYDSKSGMLTLNSARFPFKEVVSRELGIGLFNDSYYDTMWSFLPDEQKSKKTPEFIDGPYEYDKVTVKPGDVVIDGGANIGLFSVAAASAAGKQGRIYAFEPVPKNAELVERCAQLNKNITLCRYALSDITGNIQFTMSDGLSAGAFIDKVKDGDSLNEEKRIHNLHTLTVKSITLDDFAKRNKLRRVDFIKADIEGAERFMLAGAAHVLKKFEPKLSICTYHLPDDPEVLERMILDANPKYKVIHKWGKLYAYVEK
jgi:FkbM family methyltransferase